MLVVESTLEEIVVWLTLALVAGLMAWPLGAGWYRRAHALKATRQEPTGAAQATSSEAEAIARRIEAFQASQPHASRRLEALLYKLLWGWWLGRLVEVDDERARVAERAQLRVDAAHLANDLETPHAASLRRNSATH